MKVLAFLVSITVLFLTASPSLTLAFSPKTECHRSCCSHGTDKMPKECNGMGNPFMSCCSIYALTEQPQNCSTPFVYSNQNFSSPIEKACVDFLSDAWHPPKIV